LSLESAHCHQISISIVTIFSGGCGARGDVNDHTRTSLVACNTAALRTVGVWHATSLRWYT